MKKKYFSILILSLLFFSCKKETANTSGSLGSVIFTKIIPYESSFYYCQLDTPGVLNATYRNNGCLAASIMMSAAYVEPKFEVSPANFIRICNAINVTSSGASFVSAAAYLKKSTIFGNQQENILYSSNSETGKNEFLNKIKTSINNYYPLIVLVKTYSGGLSTSSNIGTNHAIVILGLTEYSSGYATVYCLDPAQKVGIILTSLTDLFLSSIANNHYYNESEIIRVGDNRPSKAECGYLTLFGKKIYTLNSCDSFKLTGKFGTPPYKYQINNSSISTDSIYSICNSGSYLFRVYDSKGCTDTIMRNF